MTRVRTLKVAMLVMVTLGAWTATAQDRSVTIGGPVLGFVPESDGTRIRSILGIPGASLVGDVLRLDRHVYGAIVSPSQDYGIALDADGGHPILIRMENPASVTVLEGVASAADLLALSPTGAAAAIYQQESGSLQLIRGLPDAPERTSDFQTRVLPGKPRQLAVSDDGTMALLWVSDASGTSLWIVDSSGIWKSIPLIAPAAAAFLPNRQDVIVSDSATGEIFILRDPAHAATRRPLMRAPGGGFRTFTAVAASADNQHVFIATEGPEAAIVIDMKDGRAETLVCKCQPTGFHPLIGGDLFLVNDLTEAPLSVLDVSSERPRILLIPSMR